mgnify:CR=1 FL=1
MESPAVFLPERLSGMFLPDNADRAAGISKALQMLK